MTAQAYPTVRPAGLILSYIRLHAHGLLKKSLRKKVVQFHWTKAIIYHYYF